MKQVLPISGEGFAPEEEGQTGETKKDVRNIFSL